MAPTAVTKRWHRLAKEAQSLSNQILELEAELRTVRANMNPYSTACSIPQEILLEVFLHVYRDVPVPDTALALASVCRVWQTIVHGYPPLWYSIVPGHEAFVALCVERAAKTPLQLSIPDHSIFWTRPSSVDTVAPFTKRFVHIDVIQQSRDIGDFCYFLCTKQWDQLETLRLGVPLQSKVAKQVDLGFETPLPHLRELRLSAIVPHSWHNVESFINLRVLELYNVFEYAFLLPPLPEFLNLLESLVLLEELMVEDAGFKPLSDDDDAVEDLDRVVKLDKLRFARLIIKNFRDHAYLLAHLAIPKTTHVIQEVYEDGVSPDSYLSLFPRDRSNLAYLDVMSHIYMGSDLVVRGHHHQHHEQSVQDPCMHVLAVKDREATTSRDCLLHIGPLFHNAPVVYFKFWLALSQLRLVTTEDWITILSQFHSLTTLEFHQVASPGMFSGGHENLPNSLSPLLDALTVSPGKDPLCPTLRTLRLVRVHWLTLEIIGDYTDECLETRRAALGGKTESFQIEVVTPWEQYW
ncbi:hypothetical protein EIP91_012394 [Steccherinum ochraceum]|uniref:Uncharacterized protein n=1 Tax=Steccherinum ochraceum TaxID=92696 RepID=A0A4R0RJW6_9APHY|nr:hypothetical protein EIP91_012394 [Steccherinum ochraceum]